MEIPRSARRPAPHALLLVAIGAAAFAGLAITAIDRPVARLIAAYEPLEVWDQGIAILEQAIGLTVHPLFVSLTLTAIAVAAAAVPRLRAMAPAAIFVAGTHVFSRFAVNQLKDATGRLRPSEWLARGGEATFFRDGISFPSGHVAIFASLVIPLAIVFPRARWILAIAAFVAAARVGVNAHFVSDTLAAIAVVALIAWVVGLGIRPRPAAPS